MESHQRVVETRWWSFWPGMRAEGDGWVVLVGIEGRGRQKATNESLRLVGGLIGRDRGQREVRNPPTSRDDSLVVVHSL